MNHTIIKQTNRSYKDSKVQAILFAFRLTK